MIPGASVIRIWLEGQHVVICHVPIASYFHGGMEIIQEKTPELWTASTIMCFHRFYIYFKRVKLYRCWDPITVTWNRFWLRNHLPTDSWIALNNPGLTIKAHPSSSACLPSPDTSSSTSERIPRRSRVSQCVLDLPLRVLLVENAWNTSGGWHSRHLSLLLDLEEQ